jgi:hypothetical protein
VTSEEWRERKRRDREEGALNIETRKTAECTKGVGGGKQGVLELGKHGKE